MKQLWTVLKQLVFLSHGQAMVERGFFVNKEIEVKIMAESTFTAKRMMAELITSMLLTNNLQLLLYCASVCQIYSTYLEVQEMKGCCRSEEESSEWWSEWVTADCCWGAANDFSDQAEKLQQLALIANMCKYCKLCGLDSVQWFSKHYLVWNYGLCHLVFLWFQTY